MPASARSWPLRGHRRLSGCQDVNTPTPRCIRGATTSNAPAARPAYKPNDQWLKIAFQTLLLILFSSLYMWMGVDRSLSLAFKYS
mmetsp:Transcript_57459/g.161174  ORF Transcript_57459/g.161174 Transcript_57459/m.161174 type:complete len:85 (-) Transcript_57459:847-1101(-)